MLYEIQMLSFSDQIPVGTRGSNTVIPWGNLTQALGSVRPSPNNDEFKFDAGSSLDFSSGTLQKIVVENADGTLQSGLYTTNENKTVVISTDVILGNNAPLSAGTVIASFYGTRLIDEDGNIFHVKFPRELPALDRKAGEMSGDGHSILIFPQERTDISGNTFYPKFDLSKKFNVTGRDDYAHAVPQPQSFPQIEIPCFAQGTLILTASGYRAIETLCPGDLVQTRDNGLCPIRWIGGKFLSPYHLDLQPNLRPILIEAEALGEDNPSQDLIVSPQHRVLVCSDIARRIFAEDEILVAAKHLTSVQGIRAINPTNGVGYWHMLFDRHEIVSSSGSWTESLYTGPQAMKAVAPAARREILSLFPELARPDYKPVAARRILSGSEGHKLIARHIKNKKPLVGD